MADETPRPIDTETADELAARVVSFQRQLADLQAAIRQRDALNMRLRLSRERYREFFDNANDVIFAHDLAGRITTANRAAARTFGYDTPTDLVGMSVRDLILDDYLPRLAEHSVDHESGAHASVPYEVVARRTDGDTIWLEVNPRLIRRDGVPNGVHLIARDITERKAAEETIRHQATHDALTGLPNRRLFADRLRKAISQSSRDGDSVVVLFLDLDRFKLVNDGLGHEVGDLLLTRVATRLRGCLRGADSVARRGGDEFTVLLPRAAGPHDGATAAERILEALEQPVQCGPHSIHVGASIGIAVYPDDGDNPEDLVKHADIAMYRAKAEGRGRFLYFDRAMNASAYRRMEIESAIRQALRDGTLRLEFQPRVETRTERVVAFEALLRVPGPDGEDLPTRDVVEVADDSGLIGAIGEWVVARACAVIAARPASDIPIVVNVTERECLHGDIVATVRRALATTGAAPGRLELDLCHGFAANEHGPARAVLAELTELGVRLGLDNFGTAKTSLRTLRVPHLASVTIAAEYVRELLDDARAASLTESLIDMIHRLDIAVVGFGVESREQLEWLRDAGCDFAQGVACGVPISEDETRRFLSGS